MAEFSPESADIFTEPTGTDDSSVPRLFSGAVEHTFENMMDDGNMRSIRGRDEPVL